MNNTQHFLRLLLMFSTLFALTGIPARAADKPGPLASTPKTLPQSYVIDLAHSLVEFEVKHLGISKVRGKFKEFSADFVFNPDDFSKSSGKAQVVTESIDTGLAPRDKHLRSADFLHTKEHPLATFEGRRFKSTGRNTFQVSGPLTLHGVTKEVTFDVEYLGTAKGMDGRPRLGFDAMAKIDRFDFGLTWNDLVEAVPAVGREVQIVLHIEALPKE